MATKFRVSARSFLYPVLLLCVPAVCEGAEDAGALLRQQQQTQPVPPPPSEGPTLQLAPAAPQQPTANGGKAIYVSAFRLSFPSTLLNDAQLEALLRPFTGHENTLEDLQRATARVAEVLHRRGYAFARVILPQQEILSGVVSLEILPGKLARKPDGRPDVRVTTAGKTRLSVRRAADIVVSTTPDPAALNTHDLERGLLLLNDLPGVNGSGVLIPGQEPGTLALGLAVQEAPLFGAWADADDYGSRTTGSARLVADMHLNDISGRGDAAELNLAKSLGTSTVASSYTDLITLSGLSTRIAASYMSYRVLREFSTVDATGNSLWLSGGLSYPLLRTRNGNFYWTTSVDYKRLLDDAADTQIDSRQSKSISLGVRGDNLFADGSNALSYLLTLTGGQLDRAGNEADSEQDTQTRRSQGDYAILRTADSWLEPFNARFSLSAALQMQFASRNLDTSEKMYLGGPHGVRAFPIEEAGSDSAQIVNLELRYVALKTRRWGSQIWTPFALFDAGHATLNKSLWNGWNLGNPELRNSYWLEGYGVGIRAQIAQFVQLEFIEARRIGNNPGASSTGMDADGASKQNRLWFIASFFF